MYAPIAFRTSSITAVLAAEIYWVYWSMNRVIVLNKIIINVVLKAQVYCEYVKWEYL